MVAVAGKMEGARSECRISQQETLADDEPEDNEFLDFSFWNVIPIKFIMQMAVGHVMIFKIRVEKGITWTNWI